jgi:erythromycin esterase
MRYNAICFIYFLFLITSLNAHAQNAAENIIRLQKFAAPIRTDLSDTSDYPVYSQVLGKYDMIGLGESTHGTKEFDDLKFKIIAAMVSRDNVKTVAIEFDFCGLEYLNDYLLNGKNDSLLNAMNKSGFYGIYRTQEVYRLLKWLHDYNLGRPSAEKVKLAGVDMQDPYSITQAILNRFKGTADLIPASLAALKKLNLLYSPRKEVKISGSDMDVYKEMVKDLSIVAEKEPYPYAKFYVRLLEQTLSLREISNFNDYRSLRDKYLAENALYLFAKREPSTKMILWLHNGHIAHSRISKTYRAGFHLQQKLGDKYFALAFAFNEGSVRIYDRNGSNPGYKNFSYPPSSKTNSIEYGMKQIPLPAFILDFSSLKADAENIQVLSEYDYMRVIGATYLKNDNDNFFKMPMAECFDGLLFIQKTNASEPITNTY